MHFRCLRIVVLQRMVVAPGGEAELSVVGDGEWVVAVAVAVAAAAAAAAVMELLAVEGLL